MRWSDYYFCWRSSDILIYPLKFKNELFSKLYFFYVTWYNPGPRRLVYSQVLYLCGLSCIYHVDTVTPLVPIQVYLFNGLSYIYHDVDTVTPPVPMQVYLFYGLSYIYHVDTVTPLVPIQVYLLYGWWIPRQHYTYISECLANNVPIFLNAYRFIKTR